MPACLYTLCSSLHKGLQDVVDEPFITEIEREMGEKFIFRGDDFTPYDESENNIIYVRTGGTEGIFKNLGIRKDNVRLLASGKHNSLAAAMEILAFVRKNGGKGEILHGSASDIAVRINSSIGTVTSSVKLRSIPEVDFDGARLGVIGRPSDWLIASDVDYAAVREKFGLELVDIDIKELVDETLKRKCDMKSFTGSEAIYDALETIVGKYNLKGLTVRCFDLLDTLGNTGCLALARLNAEGIPSSCEGDIPALLTMMIAMKLTGCPGFQCNLSRISGDELLFAHCTVPLSMVSRYRYDTHFESGIGTAIKGEIPEGPVTVVKVSPTLENMVVIPAELVRNQSEPGLCRTQVVLKAPGSAEYFLSSPLANHHVVVPGQLFV